ncbi:transmembrane protein 26-like [Mantella aurantiaca]
MNPKCRKFLSAFLSRLFFGVHGFTIVTALVEQTSNESYSYLLFIIALLFIEMIVTLAVTEKGEWKWFSPMVFIYLCAIIPPIFLLELKLIDYGQQELNTTTNATSNVIKEEKFKFYSSHLQILEQLMILVLVIGRWLMPKGLLKREQLSQLLLIYLGVGADILDILQLVKERAVNMHRTVAIVGLSLFCWTITQFAFVPLPEDEETPKSQKTSVTEESLSLSDIKPRLMSLCCFNEIESFLITIGVQDGPFLAYRVYVVIILGTITDSIVFFICKNILTIIIEAYRLVALYQDRRDKNREYEQSK